MTENLDDVFNSKSSSSKIDGKIIWSWFLKNKMFFLILIPILLSFYVRTGTSDMAIADSWATASVTNFIKGDINNVVTSQYPNLPDAAKNKVIDEQLSKAMSAGTYIIQSGQYKGQTADIANEIKNNAAQLKSFWQYDLNGKQVTYMPDIDPYFYLRYARNIIDKGHIGDLVIDGKNIDNHMSYPLIDTIDTSSVAAVPTLIAWNHRIVTFFDKNLDLMQTASLLPVIMIALATIPAFLLGRRITNDLGGFMIATMIAINGAALSRTLWGHPDTDMFNIFFPLLIIWLLVEAFYSASSAKRMMFSALAGITTGVYSFAWVGWWYILVFILASMGCYGIVTIMMKLKDGIKSMDPRHNKDWATISSMVFIFLFTLAIFSIVTNNTRNFIDAPLSPLTFSGNFKVAAKANLWPNVYTTVAELNPATFDTAVYTVGGNILFLVSLVGIIFLFSKSKEKKYMFMGLLLTLWMIGTFYATTKGVRFTLLIVVPFSIAFGVGIGFMYDYVVEFAKKKIKIQSWIASVLFVVAILLLFVQVPLSQARTMGGQDVPLMNDAWWNALTKIKQSSQPDAVINSWWDFGHHFKYVADRAVTSDGASQNSPPAYWIGLAMLTNDEKKSMSILRMLDCGNSRGIEFINGYTNNTAISIDIMNNAIMMDKTMARIYYLENGITDPDALLKLTHCDSAEDFFITSEDMIGKAPVWSHFGGWDFKKAYAYINLKNKPQDVFIDTMMTTFNYTNGQSQQIYDSIQSLSDETSINTWISPWPQYMGGLSQCGIVDNATICANGLRFNMSNEEATVQTQGGSGKPAFLAYLNASGNFVKKSYDDNVGISAIITPSGQSIIMSNELVDSIFTRLYFFKGYDMDYFTMFDDQAIVSGGEIITWKINWGE